MWFLHFYPFIYVGIHLYKIGFYTFVPIYGIRLYKIDLSYMISICGWICISPLTTLPFLCTFSFSTLRVELFMCIVSYAKLIYKVIGAHLNSCKTSKHFKNLEYINVSKGSFDGLVVMCNKLIPTYSYQNASLFWKSTWLFKVLLFCIWYLSMIWLWWFLAFIGWDLEKKMLSFYMLILTSLLLLGLSTRYSIQINVDEWWECLYP